MKRFFISVLTVIIAIVVLAGAVAGYFLYKRYMPTNERADLNDWFGVIGDRVAVVLDDELLDVQGRYVDGEVYLPLEWVDQTLNERFYWDEGEQRLVYVLPEEIVYADTSTLGNGGKPLLIEKEDEIWLLTGLVSTYTDVRIHCFTEGDAKRVFIDTKWEPVPAARAKKDGKVRELGGIKSPILADVKKDESLEILETLESWSKVRTETGYMGYIQNRVLEKTEDLSFVSDFQAPVYTHISLDEPISLVWHQVFSQQANEAMGELMAVTKGVNVIAPTWFMLTDNEGNYDCLASQTYVEQAHRLGLQVWAVVDNFNKGENVQSEVLFASASARQKLIESLVEDVKRYGIDGINLDIETIKPKAGPHYVQFIRELSVSCRREGIVLSVDNTVPSEYSAFYDREEQGCMADYVVIMGYDEHYAGSEPGSVASIDYVRQGVEDTCLQVPPEQVINGLPFYTRLWQVKDGETSSTAMGIAAAKDWVAQHDIELSWQEDLGQYYGEMVSGKTHYYLWMEEERSLEEKMQVIRDNGLAGVACWKLGFESPEIWDIVQLP